MRASGPARSPAACRRRPGPGWRRRSAPARRPRPGSGRDSRRAPPSTKWALAASSRPRADSSSAVLALATSIQLADVGGQRAVGVVAARAGGEPRGQRELDREQVEWRGHQQRAQHRRGRVLPAGQRGGDLGRRRCRAQRGQGRRGQARRWRRGCEPRGRRHVGGDAPDDGAQGPGDPRRRPAPRPRRARRRPSARAAPAGLIAGPDRAPHCGGGAAGEGGGRSRRGPGPAPAPGDSGARSTASSRSSSSRWVDNPRARGQGRRGHAGLDRRADVDPQVRPPAVEAGREPGVDRHLAAGAHRDQAGDHRRIGDDGEPGPGRRSAADLLDQRGRAADLDRLGMPWRGWCRHRPPTSAAVTPSTSAASTVAPSGPASRSGRAAATAACRRSRASARLESTSLRCWRAAVATAASAASCRGDADLGQPTCWCRAARSRAARSRAAASVRAVARICAASASASRASAARLADRHGRPQPPSGTISTATTKPGSPAIRN